MAFNVNGAVEVPLEVFGSLVTEMSPSDLPAGVSPDNQDVVYAPGGVESRGGLRKGFSAPFPNNPTISYGKSYVDNNGDITNLFLDSSGMLWGELFSSNPGNRFELLQSTPASYAKSVTAFGREYISISDGMHGQEVPLQYDGTNLDRVTQDGPGAPPTVVSIPLPSVQMAVTGAPPVMTVTEVDPAGEVPPSDYFTAINVFVSSVGTTSVGQSVVIAGNSNAALDGTYVVTAVYAPTLFTCSAYLPPGTTFGTGGTATAGSGITMTRQNNLVTVSTTAPHQLQRGFQAQITGVPAAPIGGGISSIVIDNENNPGLATVTTNTAHGLVPGISVSLSGITGSAVGGSITSIVRAGQVVTATTSSAHNLAPGASITISGVTDTTFNGTALVQQVTGPNVLVYLEDDVDATSSGGTITLNWPVPDSPTPSYFEVEAAPSARTFQVQVNYSDGSWGGGGIVSYAWNGTYFVSAIPSATIFQYQQYGPNATATSIGTVTPYGQAAPGTHQMQVLFLTRQGYTTRPSPPVSFVANGGQYLSVTNIPIGPSNVVARILAFTGAQGAYFFYIPVAAQVNGQLVSTATQIGDNTTTNLVLDFSDNTLYASLGISIPGNNLANQIILDGALSFGFSGSRLIAYGQRNRVQNFLNMGFDGGYLPSAPTVPSGWTSYQTNGTLAPGRFGDAWQINVSTTGTQYGGIFQNAYQDAYGAPIATPNAKYKLRCWVKTSGIAPGLALNFVFTDSASFSSAATVFGAAMSTSGSWLEAEFSEAMPSTIPPVFNLYVYATSSETLATITIDEVSIIYADSEYLETISYGSYVNNPEAFDGVSGKFGPSLDTHKIMDMATIRDTLYILTQEPSGRLHQVANNGITEPSGWQISQVAANCGMLSAFCLTKSQADDSAASGGEEWLAWASSSGARIFGGAEAWKISQEIQPDWDRINVGGPPVWALNDPVARVIYFGFPLDQAQAPTIIYPMNYRELDTPYQVAMSAPVHTSFSGKLIATDNTRKWTRWNMTMNGAALMYRTSRSKLSAVFFGGNGHTLGTQPGTGNVYTLDPTYLTDDDYGQIRSYYVSYFFVNHDAEAALQLGSHRKTLAYLTGFVSGVGTVTITPLVNTLANAWPLVCTRTLSQTPTFDLEWTGGSAIGQRMAFKVASAPITGTDNSFALQKLVPALRPASRLPLRGAAA